MNKVNSKKRNQTQNNAIIKTPSFKRTPPKPKSNEELVPGVRKVAILMIALGSDVASTILNTMSEEEIKLISKEIATLKKITHKEKEEVLEEFKELVDTKRFISLGGPDTAKDFLEKAFDTDKANQILSNVTSNYLKKPFQFLNDFDADQILLILQGELPQTIALTISYLKPQLASQVLRELPKDIQAVVAKRIAILDRPTNDIIAEVERVLSAKITKLSTDPTQKTNGINTLAEILNNLDPDSEKYILDNIEEENEELAGEIREKMFLFEDISSLSDIEIQKALESLANSDIAMALKGEDPQIRACLFSNMTKNRKKEIQDEMKYLGRVRYRDVYQAQQKIINHLKRMDEEGNIIIRYRNSENVII